MCKTNTFFVISQWKNNIDWITKYTNNYLIYDKSNDLPYDNHVVKVPNVGYNIYDICHYIYNNYDRLPETIAFLEGNPFDHCREEVFNRLIVRNDFTPIEAYDNVPESFAHKKDFDGGYMEINNSWYISSHISTHGQETNRFFSNYNQFLDVMFENVAYPEWVRFAPGGQYIVPKQNILFYSRNFYRKIMGFVDYTRIPSESHIVERSLFYIFTNKWEERK